MSISLEEVVAFFTGAGSVPILGWPTQPELIFNHTDVYPTASTCALHLVLPSKYHEDYDQF